MKSERKCLLRVETNMQSLEQLEKWRRELVEKEWIEEVPEFTLSAAAVGAGRI